LGTPGGGLNLNAAAPVAMSLEGEGLREFIGACPS
jgi:hypothetical protein